MFRAEERAHMTNPITQLNRMASANSVERLVAERTEKAEQVSDAATAAAARPSTPVAGDRLELSSTAQGASQSQEAAFNREKVEAIKQQIARGEYPLDADKMAENFMALEQLIGE